MQYSIQFSSASQENENNNNDDSRAIGSQLYDTVSEMDADDDDESDEDWTLLDTLQVIQVQANEGIRLLRGLRGVQRKPTDDEIYEIERLFKSILRDNERVGKHTIELTPRKEVKRKQPKRAGNQQQTTALNSAYTQTGSQPTAIWPQKRNNDDQNTLSNLVSCSVIAASDMEGRDRFVTVGRGRDGRRGKQKQNEKEFPPITYANITAETRRRDRKQTGPAPIVFQLPDKNAERVKAELVIALDPFETGIKINSISMHKESGKVFARFATDEDAKEAEKLIAKLKQTKETEMTMRQSERLEEDVFFISGFPVTMSTDDIVSKLILQNPQLKTAEQTMRVKKKIVFKRDGAQTYAVIMAVGSEHVGLFDRQKLFIGMRRYLITRALRRPMCGDCGRIGHFTKECSPERKATSEKYANTGCCVNCHEFNEKATTEDRRCIKHKSTDRERCPSYLSALGYKLVRK